MLADLDAGDVRINGPEFAPDFGRRVGLQVIHVLMRWRPDHVDHDHCFVRFRDAGRLFGSQQSRQR